MKKMFPFQKLPTNNTGGTINNYDPILISLLRRVIFLIAYDVCSVQPMTRFNWSYLRNEVKISNSGGTEALFNEPDASFSNDDDIGDLNNASVPFGASLRDKTS